MKSINKLVLGSLAIVGALVFWTAYLYYAHDKKGVAQVQATAQQPASDTILSLGDGWYAAVKYTAPQTLKSWEAEMREKGLMCRFMGISRSDATKRNGGRISPPVDENLYLCRERTLPAQEYTVE
jgi:hypothetical protein